MNRETELQAEIERCKRLLKDTKLEYPQVYLIKQAEAQAELKGISEERARCLEIIDRDIEFCDGSECGCETLIKLKEKVKAK